jgi:hypothetical protein
MIIRKIRLNYELFKQFKEETNFVPIYQKDGMTMHTIEYVNWLEKQIENRRSPAKGENCDACMIAGALKEDDEPLPEQPERSWLNDIKGSMPDKGNKCGVCGAEIVNGRCDCNRLLGEKPEGECPRCDNGFIENVAGARKIRCPECKGPEGGGQWLRRKP